MDKKSGLSYNAGMSVDDFFGGLEFLFWDELYNCSQRVFNIWSDYCALQFDEAGPLEYVFGKGQPKRHIDGAYSWVTYPGPEFLFGSPAGTSRIHRYVCFRGPRMHKYIETGLIATGPIPLMHPVVRPIRFAAAMQDLIQCLGPDLRNIPGSRSDLGGGRPVDYCRAVNLLEGLLLSLKENAAEAQPWTLADAIGDIAHRITAHPEDDWDFHAEARRLHISEKHFRNVFTGNVGLAPGQFLQKARLELAAQLLRVTNKTLAEVAGFVRIDDIYYFNRLFKRQHGLPPGQFRRELTRRRIERRRKLGR